MTDFPKPSRPSRLVPLAVAGSAALAMAGGVAFWYATQTAPEPERGQIHKVVVGDRDCDPMDFTLPAGRTTFEIHNASARPIEWEILDGVMVVEERENIAPGFHSLLTAKLKPGTFQITCGLLSNPRGALVVTPSEESEAERAAPPVTAFIGPLSEYKVWLGQQSAALVAETARLTDAIRAGDIVAAQAQYLAARLPYKRIEAVTGRIADLENAIDPLADYLENREADPGFTGFHRIEYGLWVEGDTASLVPVADRLLADVTVLQERLKALRLAPEDLAGTAARQADRLAEGQIRDGENRYGFTDPAEFAANLDGMEKAVQLLRPLVADAVPEVAADVDQGFAEARAALEALKTPDGWPAYDAVPPEDRERLAGAFRALTIAIAAVNPVIGLE
ncbi:iron uptake system protein EfeO [Pseudogemmobacter sonorensis]|uniref:iron uptake system protein EfeO n=1 Tax=Pseudogemmobacter sonorensis TaxID=2989681 RepID=UPI0036A034AA